METPSLSPSHAAAFALVALALLLLFAWCACEAIFPEYYGGHYGTRDEYRFSNDLRVREQVDESSWGEGKRKYEMWKEGEAK